MVVRHVAKPYETNGKSILLKTHKPSKPQLIIIRTDNDYPDPPSPPLGGGGAGFLGLVTIGPSGWIMKGAGRRISRIPKTLKKHCLEQLLRISKFTFGKRYKTNGKLMLFEPKSENGFQNHQKAQGFSL